MKKIDEMAIGGMNTIGSGAIDGAGPGDTPPAETALGRKRRKMRNCAKRHKKKHVKESVLGTAVDALSSLVGSPSGGIRSGGNKKRPTSVPSVGGEKVERVMKAAKKDYTNYTGDAPTGHGPNDIAAKAHYAAGRLANRMQGNPNANRFLTHPSIHMRGQITRHGNKLEPGESLPVAMNTISSRGGVRTVRIAKDGSHDGHITKTKDGEIKYHHGKDLPSKG